MKKFTKLFLSCAAVAAVTAAVATSAMAADVTGDLAGTYTDGKLSLTTEFTGTTTVLVLAPGTDSTAVSADDILYIDQVEDGVLGEMGVKGAPTEETKPGKYTVLVGSYVGGEFVVKTGSFSLGGHDVVLGDVDADEEITTGDASLILRQAVGQGVLTESDALIAADVDEDEEITTGDASLVLRKAVGQDVEGPGKVVQAQ
ncbi:MAG: dockerin type I repeat-containing protein [Clostridia bacterium]|nr:dockerin type I repeat-containing protein [Clostridia bacterium]